MLYSFHTHSELCDGKSTMEEICAEAQKLGFSAIGFSSHAPLFIPAQWALKFENLNAYINKIDTLKQQHKNKLKIYRALEADYIPHKTISFKELRKIAQLDYIIGSIHIVENPDIPDNFWFLDGPDSNYEEGISTLFNGDIKKAIGQYYSQIQSMINEEKPDIIGHMDKVVMKNKDRYFRQSDNWYQSIIDETLEVIKQAGTIVEINLRGIYRKKYPTTFPNANIIKKCIALKIPLTVSVDAHHKSELLNGFIQQHKTLKEMGLENVSVFNGNGWEQIPVNDVINVSG